jgi:hypothetical protein
VESYEVRPVRASLQRWVDVVLDHHGAVEHVEANERNAPLAHACDHRRIDRDVESALLAPRHGDDPSAAAQRDNPKGF